MTEERLKKLLQAASDHEAGKTATYNRQDAEEAEDIGLLEIGTNGTLTLTDAGRTELASFS